MLPVFLIRHGQSTFNAAFEATGADPMLFDAPLSAVGLEQIERARGQVASIPKPDVILSSPLTRALQTTLGLFGNCDVPITVSALHRERLEYSCDVGRPPKALATEFPSLRFDHLEDLWWHNGAESEHGISVEPLDDFFGRVDRFAAWMRSQRNKTIVVVGHGSFFRKLTGYEFENCEIRPWQIS